MKFQTKEFDVKNLYLKTDNPRHNPISSQPEIIEHLLANEKAFEAAKDIASHGLNPLDRIGVIQHPKNHNAAIVVEGNRRICAVKLLNDPDLAPKRFKRKFHALVKEYSPIETLGCILFSSYEESRHWISLRHEGEQSGVGIRPWNATQKARFNYQGNTRQINQNYQALQLMDYAVNRNLVTPDEHSNLNISTLTRFLSNPIFRSVLGLIDGRSLDINLPQDIFDRAITRFLHDSLGSGSETGVHSRTNKKARETYAYKIQTEEQLETTRLSDVIRLDSNSGTIFATGVEDKQARSTRNPDLRTRIVPSSFVIKTNNLFLTRLYKELKSLDANSKPIACTALLRSALELTTDAFIKSQNLDLWKSLGQKKNHLKIQKAIDIMNGLGASRNDTSNLKRAASDENSLLSPRILGSALHGGHVPTKIDLNRTWDNLAAGLSFMLKHIQ